MRWSIPPRKENNLVPQYRDYIDLHVWVSEVKALGLTPSRDYTRPNFFIAVDKLGNTLGTFTTSPSFYYGIIFSSYEDKVDYMMKM